MYIISYMCLFRVRGGIVQESTQRGDISATNLLRTSRKKLERDGTKQLEDKSGTVWTELLVDTKNILAVANSSW